MLEHLQDFAFRQVLRSFKDGLLLRVVNDDEFAQAGQLLAVAAKVDGVGERAKLKRLDLCEVAEGLEEARVAVEK